MFDSSYVLPIAIGVVGATAASLLTPFALTARLRAIGFGAAGIIAGSIAAGAQAGIGNAIAEFFFATAQNVAIGEAVPAAASAGISGVMAACGC